MMNKERLLAFTDGVLAVVLTIMVLELKPPEGAALAALATRWPVFLSYVLSFIYIGIYWSNHHQLFTLVKRVKARSSGQICTCCFGSRWRRSPPPGSVSTARRRRRR